jgi:heat shock protein HtpX
VIGINRAKTWVLIAALGGLFVLIGGAFFGSTGAWTFLLIGLAINFALYWFSDRIAIATTRSHAVTEHD